MIPALPPSTSFELLSGDPNDFEFSLDAKREALGPYILDRWGWDDEFQRNVHRQHYESKPFFRIADRKRSVGTVSWQENSDHFRFGEFYLLNAFQRQGLGTQILLHCLKLADARKLPVRLEYLKWNPVGKLYARHGFRKLRETDIHWFLERPVQIPETVWQT